MSIFYPVQLFADWLTYSVLGIPPETVLASAVNFFIYDTIKIFILLGVIIFVVSIIRSFLPPEKIRTILSSEKKYLGNIMAALFGIITPFCSCSAVPLFLGFLEAGVPLGITFSFLVASPMINEVAVALIFGLFGWKVAMIYIISGLLIAVFSGIIIGHLKVDGLVKGRENTDHQNKILSLPSLNWRQRVDYAQNYTIEIIKSVWIYVVIGVGIGAWIHGYVPTEMVVQYTGNGAWYAVPLAVIIGIPLYSNAAGIIPLVSVLIGKGVSMGTTLAFMMAVTALSIPEFLILKKIMKTRLIMIFAGVVGMGIVFTGYLFNYILRQ